MNSIWIKRIALLLIALLLFSVLGQLAGQRSFRERKRDCEEERLSSGKILPHCSRFY